jgi:hypothetical protein
MGAYRLVDSHLHCGRVGCDILIETTLH